MKILFSFIVFFLGIGFVSAQCSLGQQHAQARCADYTTILNECGGASPNTPSDHPTAEDDSPDPPFIYTQGTEDQFDNTNGDDGNYIESFCLSEVKTMFKAELDLVIIKIGESTTPEELQYWQCYYLELSTGCALNLGI